MEQKKSRRDQAADTKRRIFETAAELIQRKGYRHVTVSEICQAAGLAKGSFYVHYSSKEDIVRESYYSDLGQYLQTRYEAFTEAHPNSSAAERITYFLNQELAFSKLAGHELTCLAYSLNLSACVSGPAEHFEKRTFSQILRREIRQGLPDSSAGLTCDEVFQYLESVVRGIMATWCFAGGSFDIAEQGEKFIRQAVSGIAWAEN